MAIFAVYYALKVDNLWMIPLMFIVSIPVLLILGYINTHHMKKVMEYLNIEFSTHWGRYNFDLLEKQVKLLEEIRDVLDKRVR
jgi:hypothetical protein